MKPLDSIELKKLTSKTDTIRPFNFSAATDVVELKEKGDCFEFEIEVPKGKKIKRAHINAKIAAQVLGGDQTVKLGLVKEYYKGKQRLTTKIDFCTESFTRQRVGKRIMEFNVTDRKGYIESNHITSASKIKFKIFLDSKSFKPCVSLMKSSLELVLTLE